MILTGLYPSAVINDVTTASIVQEYTDWTTADDADADYYQSTLSLGTDYIYGCPKDKVARLHAEAGDTVFTYLMTHAPSKWVYKMMSQMWTRIVNIASKLHIIEELLMATMTKWNGIKWWEIMLR